MSVKRYFLYQKSYLNECNEVAQGSKDSFLYKSVEEESRVSLLLREKV